LQGGERTIAFCALTASCQSSGFSFELTCAAADSICSAVPWIVTVRVSSSSPVASRDTCTCAPDLLIMSRIVSPARPMMSPALLKGISITRV